MFHFDDSKVVKKILISIKFGVISKRKSKKIMIRSQSNHLNTL